MKLFRRRNSRYRAVEAALGYRFKDPAMLENALTHRSHLHETGGDAAASYERLEFLGDAVLDFFVSEWLYRDDGDAAEGVLSRRRQAVVRTGTLAEAARRIGLGEAIRLGRGEQRTGGRTKTSLLADTFEAVLGAVYLDGGVRAGRAFVRRHLAAELDATSEASDTADDYKTRLQEKVQARLRRAPTYRIVSRTGPDHDLRFRVEVLVGHDVLATGTGKSRKTAEQAAAREALDSLERSRGGKG